MSEVADRVQTDVQSFHLRLKPRPAEAFLALRALAVSLGPDVVERVGDDAVTYLRRDAAFLVVQHARGKLHVGFPGGAKLGDPNGRLLRRGEERYVVVDGPEGVDAHVQEFVRKGYSSLR